MPSEPASIQRLMARLLTLSSGHPAAGKHIEVVLEFMGLRPPFRIDLTPGEALQPEDPRRKVFEAQLIYILNTGGLMFVLTPLPLKPVRSGPNGEPLTHESCAVSAVRFQSGRWFPVPADQIDALFDRPAGAAGETLWLFREFPLQ